MSSTSKPIKRKIIIKKPAQVVIKKVYVPYSDNIFPIMFINSNTVDELKSKFGDDSFSNILPTGLQVIPPAPSKSLLAELKQSLKSEKTTINKVIIISKIFDITKSNTIANSLLKQIDNFKKSIDTSIIENEGDIEKLEESIKKWQLEQENTEKAKEEMLSKFTDDMSSNNNPKLFAQEDIADRLNLPYWILPSRKDFPRFINETFNNATIDLPRKSIRLWDTRNNTFNDINPFPQQKFVSDFLNDNSPYRGLLLYHGLGSGKSGASILISEGFRHRKVVIMLPASLRNNYLDEVRTFGEISYKKNFYWTWITIPTNEKGVIDSVVLSVLESKGISRDIIYDILIDKNINNTMVKGIYMIDYTRDKPNYDDMSEDIRQELNVQINKMFNYKYTILHYNAGAYTITETLKRLVPNFNQIYSKLFGESKSISTLTNKDRDRLLEYIYDPENNIKNPFDDKVLVIDEIHNLTSKMVGSGYNGPNLYELIMRANNLKIVLLSGTPVINYAFELALIFNMIRGLIYTFDIPLRKTSGVFKSDELQHILSNFNLVDRFSINVQNNRIEVSRNPYGFISKYEDNHYIGVTKSELNEITDSEFKDRLLEELAKYNYQLAGDGTVKVNVYTMFPDLLVKTNPSKQMLGSAKYVENSETLFNNTYINSGDFSLKNKELFKNKIVGLVSFFNEISGIDEATGAELFPEKIMATPEETTVYMSNYQFVEYAAKRKIERDLELAGKRAGYNQSKEINDAISKTPNLFRVFSRQKGLFVFPPGIPRPQPPKKFKERGELSAKDTKLREKIKNILNIQDKQQRAKKLDLFIDKLVDKEFEKVLAITNTLIDTEYATIEEYKERLVNYEFEECDFLDECEINPDDELSYRDACERAISKLTSDNLTDNDTTTSLINLSPKYLKMLENINATPGLVFCYSQFRSVEGIEIFARVLDANGYTRLQAIVEGDNVKLVSEEEIRVGKRVRYEIEKDVWNTYLVNQIEDDKVYLDTIDEPVDIDKVYLCKYALWTGTENPEQRSKIQTEYNKLENMYGQLCLMLLVTQSGSEGISLRFIRQVHIMEPYWNNVRINQVIGRARRIKSHIYLPPQHRNVKVFNYIIKYTNEQINSSWIDKLSTSEIELIKNGEDNGFDEGDFEESSSDDLLAGFRNYAKDLSHQIEQLDEGKTSDEVLHDISAKKELLLNSMLYLVKETSVDCNFNKGPNIASDPSLATLKCYDNILSNSDFTYELISEHEKEIKVTAASQATTKVVQEKRVIIPYNVPEYGTVKLITRMPINFPEGIQGLKQLPDGHPVYDYYLFNSYYYKDNRPYKGYYKAGIIKKLLDSIVIELDDKFRDKLADYKVIEDCIREVGPLPANSSESEKLAYATQIKECHRKKTTTVQKWTCLACQKSYPMDVEKCADCDIDKEVSLSFYESAAATSAQTTETTESKPIKRKVVRKRFDE